MAIGAGRAAAIESLGSQERRLYARHCSELMGDGAAAGGTAGGSKKGLPCPDRCKWNLRQLWSRGKTARTAAARGHADPTHRAISPLSPCAVPISFQRPTAVFETIQFPLRHKGETHLCPPGLSRLEPSSGPDTLVSALEGPLWSQDPFPPGVSSTQELTRRGLETIFISAFQDAESRKQYAKHRVLKSGVTVSIPGTTKCPV